MGFSGRIVALLLAVILIAQVFIPVVKGQNTTGWSAGEVTLWSTVTLFAIIGIVYSVATSFGMA